MVEYYLPIATVIDTAAVVVLLIGLSIVTFGFTKYHFPAAGQIDLVNLQEVRCVLGTYIALALEIMIISDLLHTVVEHSIDELYELGILVVIRTTMAFFLNKEIMELKDQSESFKPTA